MSNNNKAEVDLSGVKQSTGVWLVKVPKYLSQQWTKSAEREVGKLKIGKKNGRTEVSFTLSKALSTLSSPGEKSETLQFPRDYPFTMHTAPGQNLAVFTQSHTENLCCIAKRKMRHQTLPHR